MALSGLPNIIRALEAVQPQELKYIEALKIAELIVKYYEGERIEEAICAAFLSKLSTKERGSVCQTDLLKSAEEILLSARKAQAYPLNYVLFSHRRTIAYYFDYLERMLGLHGEDRSVFVLHAALQLSFYDAIANMSRGWSLCSGVNPAEVIWGPLPNADNCLLLGLAPIAERRGENEIAALLREQSLRIRMHEYPAVVNNSKRKIGSKRRSTLYMHAIEQFITDEIKKVLGDDYGEIEINGRVKNLYSQWEKKRVGRETQPDLIGIKILVEDDYYVLWRVKEIIDRLFSHPQMAINKSDKFREIWEAIDSGVIKADKNEIDYPRSSGFSAYTMLRVDDKGMPIEMQITTFERDAANYTNENAAHWKYKFRRAYELFGDQEKYEQDLPDLKSDRDDLMYLFLSGRNEVLHMAATIFPDAQWFDGFIDPLWGDPRYQLLSSPYFSIFQVPRGITADKINSVMRKNRVRYYKPFFSKELFEERGASPFVLGQLDLSPKDVLDEGTFVHLERGGFNATLDFLRGIAGDQIQYLYHPKRGRTL